MVYLDVPLWEALSPVCAVIRLETGGGKLFEAFEESGFDFLIDTPFVDFAGNPDGVLDGVGVRATVADDADAFDAEEGSAAVFGVVDSLAEVLEGSTRKSVAELACEIGFE